MRRIPFLLAGLGIFCLSPFSLAQPTQDTWATLSSLHPGQKIQIVDTVSTKHSGVFEAVSETAISFRQKSAEKSIQKQDIRTISLAEKAHRGRRTLIGAAIGGGAGAGVGAIIGAATSHGCPNQGFCLDIIDRGEATGIGAGLGLVVGAIPGAIIGAARPSHTTIYSVNSPALPPHTP